MHLLGTLLAISHCFRRRREETSCSLQGRFWARPAVPPHTALPHSLQSARVFLDPRGPGSLRIRPIS